MGCCLGSSMMSSNSSSHLRSSAPLSLINGSITFWIIELRVQVVKIALQFSLLVVVNVADALPARLSRLAKERTLGPNVHALDAVLSFHAASLSISLSILDTMRLSTVQYLSVSAASSRLSRSSSVTCMTTSAGIGQGRPLMAAMRRSRMSVSGIMLPAYPWSPLWKTTPHRTL